VRFAQYVHCHNLASRVMPRQRAAHMHGKRGGKVEKQARVLFKPPSYSDQLCAFFRGTGTDIEGRTLEQILTWSDQLMEVCHDYIQWIFPTDESSKFNFDAPILDEDCQQAFRFNPDMNRNLRRSSQRFLQFLGLSADLVDRRDAEELRIERAPNFHQRLLMCWRGPANHNWKRISRALRCFGLVGMQEEQQALLACLVGVIVDYPGMVDEDAVGHWLNEACQKSRLNHEMTPGYVATILSSPNLFGRYCRQTLEQYDANRAGRLEFDEMLTLIRELHASLGLQPGAFNEIELAASISMIDRNESLPAHDFPRWFSNILETALAKLGEASGVAEEKNKASSVEVEEGLGPKHVMTCFQLPECTGIFDKHCFESHNTISADSNRVDHGCMITLESCEDLAMTADMVCQQESANPLAWLACREDKPSISCFSDTAALCGSPVHSRCLKVR